MIVHRYAPCMSHALHYRRSGYLDDVDASDLSRRWKTLERKPPEDLPMLEKLPRRFSWGRDVAGAVHKRSGSGPDRHETTTHVESWRRPSIYAARRQHLRAGHGGCGVYCGDARWKNAPDRQSRRTCGTRSGCHRRRPRRSSEPSRSTCAATIAAAGSTVGCAPSAAATGARGEPGRRAAPRRARGPRRGNACREATSEPREGHRRC
jgi:hypothetical protein